MEVKLSLESASLSYPRSVFVECESFPSKINQILSEALDPTTPKDPHRFFLCSLKKRRDATIGNIRSDGHRV